MIQLSPRRQEVVNLLFQGYSNKEIANALGVGLRTVREHLLKLYLQTGVHTRIELLNEVRKPAGLAIPPQWKLTPRESEIALKVADGLMNREITAEIGTSEGMVKNYLRVIFDKAGVWSRLELALRIRDMQVTQ